MRALKEDSACHIHGGETRLAVGVSGSVQTCTSERLGRGSKGTSVG